MVSGEGDHDDNTQVLYVEEVAQGHKALQHVLRQDQLGGGGLEWQDQLGGGGVRVAGSTRGGGGGLETKQNGKVGAEL